MSTGQKLTAAGSYMAGQGLAKASQAVTSGVARTAVAAMPKVSPPRVDARSARVDYTPPKRVAPKVQPHQDASSVFGRIKNVTGVSAVEKALDTAAPKPKRNTRGW
jgi:hypothetical protein